MSSVFNSGGQTTGRDEEMLLLEPSGDNMNIESTPSTLVLLNKSDDKTPPLQLGEFKSLNPNGGGLLNSLSVEGGGPMWPPLLNFFV